jgi:cholesterol transport system auxiliary component
MIKSPLPHLCALASALALCGCITVFPNAPPANLYRFGASPSQAQAQGPAGTSQFSVLDAGVGFDREAASDRILTVTGNQVAYIKDARWAAPASVQFHEAELSAFDQAGGPARLIQKADVSQVDYVLKLDVRRFEARYESGPQAPPTIVVEVHAYLNRFHDHGVAGDRVFEAKVPASDNRVGAITQAFDEATSKVLGDVTAWVNQAGVIKGAAA